MKTNADEISTLTRLIAAQRETLTAIRAKHQSRLVRIDALLKTATMLQSLPFVTVDQEGMTTAESTWLQERRQIVRERNEETRRISRTIKDCKFRIDALLDEGSAQVAMEFKD